MSNTMFLKLVEMILTSSEVGIISNLGSENPASQDLTPSLAGPLLVDDIVRSSPLPSAQAQDATSTVSAFTNRC